MAVSSKSSRLTWEALPAHWTGAGGRGALSLWASCFGNTPGGRAPLLAKSGRKPGGAKPGDCVLERVWFRLKHILHVEGSSGTHRV